MHGFWAATACFLAAETATAAGNAHVVDDAEVETEGVCHLETWATLFSRDGGLVTAAPACTLRGLSQVEFGASVLHGWSEGDAWTTVAPAVKVALRPVGRGPGLGLSMTAAMDLDSGRVETAAFVVPLTFDVAEGVRVNLNAGYAWSRTGDRHSAFVGAQADYRVTRTLSLMGELFGRRSSQPGWQAGLRWTPRDWIDLDLLAGRRVDGTPRHAFTLGVTLRR